MHRRLLIFAVIALAAALAWVMIQSVLRRADTTYNYPEYSSLNNSDNGTKAYFEVLGRLGLAASRNYKPVRKLVGEHAAIFYADAELWRTFRYSETKEFEEFERLAASGARVILALEADSYVEVRPLKLKPPSRAKEKLPEDNLKKRWGVELSYVDRKVPKTDGEYLARVNMRPVRWQFCSWTPEWTASEKRDGAPVLLKRAFGKGSIVLVANVKLLTNRELLLHPDADVLAAAPGAYRSVIFDENHLGVADTGTVVGLARAHGLAWMLLGFVVVAVLYVWHSAIGFVPRYPASEETGVAGQDAHVALSHLLMHSVASAAILRVAGEEWNRSAKLQARATARVLSEEDLDRLNRVPREAIAAEYRALAARFSQRSTL